MQHIIHQKKHRPPEKTPQISVQGEISEVTAPSSDTEKKQLTAAQGSKSSVFTDTEVSFIFALGFINMLMQCIQFCFKMFSTLIGLQ